MLNRVIEIFGFTLFSHLNMPVAPSLPSQPCPRSLAKMPCCQPPLGSLVQTMQSPGAPHITGLSWDFEYPLFNALS